MPPGGPPFGGPPQGFPYGAPQGFPPGGAPPQYRPPPGFGGPHPGAPITPMTPGANGLPPHPGVLAGPPVVQATLPSGEEKLLTVFVSKIPDEVKDEAILRLMRVAGEVKLWKRVTILQGRPKGCGFCVYQNMEAVYTADRLFNGTEPIVLQDGKALMVTLDGATKEKIMEMRQTRDESEFEEADQTRKQQIQEIVDIIKGDKVDSFLDSIDGGQKPGSAIGELLSKTQLDALDDLPPDFPPEQREVVLREIQLFRERAAMKDKERKEREEHMALEKIRQEERQRQFEQERQRQRVRRESHDEHRGLHRKRGSRTEDDEELEQKRREKRQKDMEAALRERESRWEQEETARAQDRAKTMRSREEHFRRLADQEERWTKEFEEFDDDATPPHEFYRDREHWFHMRRRMREGEARRDEEDRREEQRELENAQRVPDEQEAVPEREATPPPVVVGRIMTKEERTAAQQQLISTIPADRAGLFQWAVKWEYLDEALLNGNIKDFVSRKVAEYFGEEEPMLIKVVLDHLKKKGTGEEVLKEMQSALDEDAEVFTLKVWRRVVFETEARSQGLG
ncbi:hypothetical protein HDV00_005580 [Rhizophlyctis rosea]|nr:hypothetical protein HDV00_005580 [Rhizophlyctis rosea]